jgi:hypothetical protein
MKRVGFVARKATEGLQLKRHLVDRRAVISRNRKIPVARLARFADRRTALRIFTVD